MGFVGKLFRFFTVRATEGIVVLLLIAFMPNLPPYCTFSEPRTITPALDLEGKLAVNNKLDDVEIWHKGELLGPEAFADYKGELYASLLTGEIVKLTGNHITPIVKFGKPCKGLYEERICGRPLGLEFDKSGLLFAADAYYGIFRVDVKTGDKIQLISHDVEIGGKKPKLTNSLTVASNGDIYWTDSSTQFTLEDGMMDMFADGSGRLVHYNSRTKENTILIDNLMFANGVALSEDEEFVIVAETGASMIHRYYIKGPKKGQSDVFIDGLPGLPDNLKPDGKGGFFVPLITPRDSNFPLPTQFLAPFPFLRKFVARFFGLTELGFKLINQVYPNEYAERAIHFVGHFSALNILFPGRVTILHVSKSGEIINSFHSTTKKISMIAETHIFKDYMYFGSPFNDYIGRIPLSQLGLSDYAHTSESPKPTTTSTAHSQTPPTTRPPPITTPKPTTTTQKPTTTTQKPTTTTTQKPITTTQKPKTTTQKPTTTTQKPTTTTQKPTTTTQKPITTTQRPATSTQKSTTTTQKTTTSAKKTTTE